MAGRRLLFYYLLDLLPSLCVLCILLSIAGTFILLLFVADVYSKQNKGKKKCNCTKECPPKQGSNCCGKSGECTWYLVPAKELRGKSAQLMKLFFSHAWKEKKKYQNFPIENVESKKGQNKLGDRELQEKKDKDEVKDKKSQESSTKSEENNDVSLDLDELEFENTLVLSIFIFAFTFCLTSAFIALWDSVVVKSQPDNCVTGLDCYPFVGQGIIRVLWEQPLDCSQNEFDNSTGMIFCYNLGGDITQGFSAAGGALFSAGVYFLLQSAIVSTTKSENYDYSARCGRCAFHFFATCSVFMLWPTLIPLKNPQVFFISDASKSLQVIIFAIFHVLAANIPTYLIKKKDKSKEESTESKEQEL